MHLPRSWQSSASLSPWLHSRCSLISLAFGIWADSNLRQEFCVNSLLNGFNVEAIIPTGSGKTLIVYLYALALRQLFPESKSLVLVGLCSIVTSLLSPAPFCSSGTFDWSPTTCNFSYLALDNSFIAVQYLPCAFSNYICKWCRIVSPWSAGKSSHSDHLADASIPHRQTCDVSVTTK